MKKSGDYTHFGFTWITTSTINIIEHVHGAGERFLLFSVVVPQNFSPFLFPSCKVIKSTSPAFNSWIRNPAPYTYVIYNINYVQSHMRCEEILYTYVNIVMIFSGIRFRSLSNIKKAFMLTKHILFYSSMESHLNPIQCFALVLVLVLAMPCHAFPLSRKQRYRHFINMNPYSTIHIPAEQQQPGTMLLLPVLETDAVLSCLVLSSPHHYSRNQCYLLHTQPSFIFSLLFPAWKHIPKNKPLCHKYLYVMPIPYRSHIGSQVHFSISALFAFPFASLPKKGEIFFSKAFYSPDQSISMFLPDTLFPIPCQTEESCLCWMRWEQI